MKKPYNALNDFTEADKAKENLIMLRENKFKSDCEEPKKDGNGWVWFRVFCIAVFVYFVSNLLVTLFR
jgi:hypothetical protein